MLLYLFRGVQAEGMANGRGARTATWTDKRKQSTDARGRGGCCTRTRAGNAREKAKDSAGLATAKRQTDETNRVREEDENVDWPQIESHPFITLGCVSSLGSVSSYSFVVLLPGSLALWAKIGTSLWSSSPLPFLPRRGNERFSRQRVVSARRATNRIRGTVDGVSYGSCGTCRGK
ncbi:hypothetical protein K0M31_017943 [Melipona bicolor]|uniref:Uncharacterized protein n=1 Tax=Melipona bicolor TaxID=60889 RepID=A0AA40KSW2_9HYME|nr:hypothetical protein K0M31_017943 [Melipona bicolor]